MMRAGSFFAGLVVALPALAQNTPPAGPYVGHQLVRVSVNDGAQRDQVLDLATTAWNCTPGMVDLDLQVTQAQLDAIRALGLEPVVIVPDVQAFLDAAEAENNAARMQRDAAWFGAFKTLTEIHARLDHFAATYPGIVTTFVAGNTLEGRPIKGIRITGPDQPGNPRSTRPAILFNACQHAREWATPMTTMWIADRMIENYGSDGRLTGLVNDVEIIIIPVVNCDGYEYSWTAGNRLWRKNRRNNGDGSFGVDTNRNWGFGWGGEGASTATGNETYRGTGPFSEPETQVMRDFITANPRIIGHNDFHSYSQLILTPTGTSAVPPAERPVFAALEADMKAAIVDVHGRTYTAGPLCTTIYPASGGAVDWLFGDRGVVACSIEVRDTGTYGFVMPVAEIIPNAEENFEAAMVQVEYAKRALMVVPAGPVPLAIGPDPVTLRMGVRNNARALSGDVTLHTRINGGSWGTSAMTAAGGIEYQAALAPLPCGGVLEYYVEATASDGRIVRYPAEGALAPILAQGAQRYFIWADDMEVNRGWVTTNNTGSSAGRWSRCDPEPTAAQPADDATVAPGTLAWLTDCRAGTTVNSFDVDGGTNHLTSPAFSAFPLRTMTVGEVRLTFSYWFSNNQGTNPNTDCMPVLVSNNNGQTWTQISEVSGNLGVWGRQSINLTAGVTPSDQMKVRFSARDLNDASTVECGIDDVLIEVFGCPADADVNCDFSLDGFDVECQERAVGGDMTDYCKPDPDFNGDLALDGFDVYDVEVAVGGG